MLCLQPVLLSVISYPEHLVKKCSDGTDVPQIKRFFKVGIYLSTKGISTPIGLCALSQAHETIVVVYT